MRVGDLGEFGLIDVLSRGAPVFAGVSVGIGDDAAVVAPPSKGSLLLTCDIMYEGVHFHRDWYRQAPRALGRKALTVNISDIGAKAGRPRYCLVTLGVEAGEDVEFVREVYEGLFALAQACGISVVGGDTIRVPRGMLIDIALIGETTTAQVPLRSGARPGDVIAVTGDFGAARAGLALLAGDLPVAPACDIRVSQAPVASGLRQAAIDALLTPPLRLAEALALGAMGPHAMSDTSDGLAAQVMHISRASKVGALLIADAIPLSACASAVARATGEDELAWGLWGGEEYELILTLPPERVDEAKRAVAAIGGTALTVVGSITPGPGVFLRKGGTDEPVRAGGFDHFALKGR